jgi:hypothetical protein
MLSSSSAAGRHRRLRTHGQVQRKVVALAEKLGRTATMLAMLLLIGAALLLSVNPPDSGATAPVPAASYNE